MQLSQTGSLFWLNLFYAGVLELIVLLYDPALEPTKIMEGFPDVRYHDFHCLPAFQPALHNESYNYYTVLDQPKHLPIYIPGLFYLESLLLYL